MSGSDMGRIRLVVSDVDGTLLDSEKRLTDRAKDAVRKLREAGIGFSIISARPPAGVRELAAELGLTEPIGCMNGAVIISPRLEILRETPLEQSDTRKAGTIILAFGLALWAFVGCEWYATDSSGPHVTAHMELLGHPPLPLENVDDLPPRVDKLVGVSDDYTAVEGCELVVRNQCGVHVSATRSQQHYLDVTNAHADKGTGVEQLAELMQVPLAEVATIGDMPTDTFMFRKSGLSIAMGNANPEVKSQATAVTAANDQEGFAVAMEKYVLSRVTSQKA